MKIIVFIFLFSSYALSQKVDRNYITYYNYASEAEYYFHEEMYDSAKYYFERGFVFAEFPRPTHHSKYAKALWKLGETEQAINEILLNRGIVKIDSVWFSGLSTVEYASINDVLGKNFYEDNNVRFHRKFCDSLMLLDQSVRGDFEVSDSIKFARMNIQDSLNAVALIEFTKKYGFPGGVNAGWDQTMATLMLHMRKEWFVENYQLLYEEVKKGNLEPWALARGIDRMFAIECGEERISPNNRYHSGSAIDPFLMFQNCVTLGVSPYYDYNWLSKPKQTIYFDYYKENKRFYNTSYMIK